MAEQIAPLWETKANLPFFGIELAKLALSCVWVDIIPMQLGPIIRRSPLLASFFIFASTRFPFIPVSFPPAEIIIVPPTFALTHSLIIEGTLAIGVAMTAISIGCWISDTDR